MTTGCRDFLTLKSSLAFLNKILLFLRFKEIQNINQTFTHFNLEDLGKMRTTDPASPPRPRPCGHACTDQSVSQCVCSVHVWCCVVHVFIAFRNCFITPALLHLPFCGFNRKKNYLWAESAKRINFVTFDWSFHALSCLNIFSMWGRSRSGSSMKCSKSMGSRSIAWKRESSLDLAQRAAWRWEMVRNEAITVGEQGEKIIVSETDFEWCRTTDQNCTTQSKPMPNFPAEYPPTICTSQG